MNREKWEGMTNVAEEILSPRWNFAIKLPSINNSSVILQTEVYGFGTADAKGVSGSRSKEAIASEPK
jgi:hypothetical protein